jgi:hypothetical protein
MPAINCARISVRPVMTKYLCHHVLRVNLVERSARDDRVCVDVHLVRAISHTT